MTRTPRRPRDTNQLAKMVVDLATREAERRVQEPVNEARQRGGIVGGKARANSLDEKRRSEIARAAAEARWKKPD